MMLACLPFAVLLPLLPAMTSQAAEPAPAVAGPKDQRVAAAADAYGQARFAEAAVAFESLYRDHPDEPRFLFNAGASRYAAQHYAHAVVHFNEYTTRPDIQDSDRKDAQAQLDEARNRVASVQLTVRVPAGARDEVTFIVRRVGRGPHDQRPELQFAAAPVGDVATLSVQVEPGVWAVQLRGPAYTTTDQSFEVRGLGPQRLDLQLAQAGAQSSLQPSQGPRKTTPGGERRLAVSLGVTGGLTSVVGVAVLAAGLAKRRQLAVCSDDELVCQDNLSGALTVRDAGAATLGVGVGVLAGGLVWLGRDPLARRKVWIGGSVVGGLATVGGVAGLVVASRAYNSANAARVTDWDAHYSGPGKAPLRGASAAILGLGLGLVTSSVTSLILQRRLTNPGLRALRIDGAASPWLTGVVVSGRF